MKKLILLFTGLLFCVLVYGQKISNLPAVTENADTSSLFMIRAGSSGNVISTYTLGRLMGMYEADSLIKVGNYLIALDENGDTLDYYSRVAIRGDIYDYVSRKYLTDTLLITDAGYTLVLADAGRYIRTYHATSVNIIVPPNTDVALPVGTVINFVSTLGSINFVTGSGVTFNSELDSLNVANKGGGATLIKRATDKWDLVGSLLN